MNKNLKAYFALLGANAIYAGNYTIAKMAMPEWIKPFGFIVLRDAGALILFWLAHKIFVKEEIQREDMGRIAVCAIFGIAINQLFFFKGLSITTPINASIIMTSTPVLVLIVAAILSNEKITLLKAGGIVAGLAGALLILLFGKNFQFGSETMSGDALVLINSTSYGVYLVLMKPLMHKYHPLTVIRWVFFIGLLYVLPFGYGEFMEVEWQSFPNEIWFAVTFVVVGTTFFAYLFNTFALKQLEPSVVSTFIYLQPLFAAIIAISLGKDELTAVKVVSALLISAGVWMVSRKVVEKG